LLTFEVSMDPRDRQVVSELATRIRELEPRARVWAFGSRARGDAAPESDLDLCIVLPAVTSELRRRVRALAWHIGFDHDRVVATVIVPEAEFENGPLSASALVRAIRAEGVAA
jgi:predicted nucleotidyltransferase